MDVLDYDQIWSGPSGKAILHAAVMRCIEKIFRSGEEDEQVVLHRTLALMSRDVDLMTHPSSAIDNYEITDLTVADRLHAAALKVNDASRASD